jgi:HSP20 family protein
MNREDIQVALEDGVLTVSGERKLQEEKEGKNYLHRERAYGRFTRSFQMGKNVQADKISATYKDGVLRITLPKAEEVKPRQIEVTVS